MFRISYRAAASLFIVALSLTGCGEEQHEDDPTATPRTAAPRAAQAKLAVESHAAQAVVTHYADLAFAIFSDAQQSAQYLQNAVHALLAKPSPETLKAAREAWITARIPYTQSEVFRFSNPVVDEWESQLNAWPLDEGLIDYVGSNYQPALGNPSAKTNIIANAVIQAEDDKIDLKDLTADKLASLNQLGGYETNVTTGYHVIEFLLWGAQPSKRPASDFMEGKSCTGGHCDRRRTYLKVVTDLLVSDLAELIDQWQPDVPDNYRAELLSDTPASGLHKMLFGMMHLSTGTIGGERLNTLLDEHPITPYEGFSNNTANALMYNERGIANLYLGTYRTLDGRTISGAGLSSLVQSVSSELDKTLKANITAAEAQLDALVQANARGENISQTAAPANEKGQTLIRNAINALTKQTSTIEKAAQQLGLPNLSEDNDENDEDTDR